MLRLIRRGGPALCNIAVTNSANVPVGSIRKARRLLRGVWAAKKCCKAASLVYARPRQDAKMEILAKTNEEEWST
jgi:hypothetical protein